MKRQWLAVTIILLGLVATSIWLAENYQARAVEAQKRLAMGELSRLRAAIDGQFTSTLVVLKAFQAEVAIRPSFSQQDFNLLATHLIDRELPIRNVAVARGLIVRYVYPLEGNESVLGFDYRRSSEQFNAVQKAINEERIIISGPVDLVQGGRALIARAALLADGEYWGMVAGVIDIDRLLKSIHFYQHPLYDFSLRHFTQQQTDPTLIGGDSDIWQQQHVAVNISVPGYEWQIAAVPKSGVWAHRELVYYLILCGSLLATLLITTFLVFTLRGQMRLREALKTIDKQARFDSVCELPNRTAFIQHLKHCVSEQAHFAVLFIDLDHFKEVNDTLGHDFGDQLLCEVAARTKGHLRESDFFARLGGDEFVILLHQISDSAVLKQIAGELNRALCEPFEVNSHHVQVSASIGIALYPQDGDSAESLLKQADLAMYAAKAAGRHTHRFFNDELRAATEQREKLRRELQQALTKQEFVVYYQPIINLATGRIAKCEALVRWQQGDTIISPDRFIPIAEQTGIIVDIGAQVFEQICIDWVQLNGRYDNIGISINKSEQELYSRSRAKQWVDSLRRVGIDTSQVIFEITESMLMSGKKRQLEVLDYLRTSGIKIALDDFGTGYSSISYLQQYHVDYIKIDRQFVSEAPDNKVQVALLNALLGVSKALGIETIAEGIETEQQADWLTAHGCHCGQGFYYCRPINFEQLLAFIEEWETRR